MPPKRKSNAKSTAKRGKARGRSVEDLPTPDVNALSAAATPHFAEEGAQATTPRIWSKSPSPMSESTAAARRQEKSIERGLVASPRVNPLINIEVAIEPARAKRGRDEFDSVDPGTFPARFGLGPEQERRFKDMVSHADEARLVYAISQLPKTCTWGNLSADFEDISQVLTDAGRVRPVTTWMLVQLKRWTLRGAPEKVSVGFLPLRKIDLDAAQDVLYRLATDHDEEDRSPLVWASRWLRERKGGPRIEFESVYDLRRPVAKGEDLEEFPIESLAEGDILLVEAGVARWFTGKKRWKTRYNLEALYWLHRPDRIETPSPEKKRKTSSVLF
ncbi:hypothetical protein CERSUDRAFT_99568 [Gelatoporia subvermispora B]|uniref:Uncharacterized protein n=1 Tax=Ceriporiopsis subvermispora (strain B) TaxID=914234 RepID=M2PAG7_CERS8|nr:hypothetical protein CERSUDRAFT_99568 [Gelatoporia subvermispora B]